MRPDLPASWLTTWHPDPAAVALTLLVALPYAAAWWCAPRPHRPHPWRATAYLLVGVVLLAYAT